MSGHNRGFGTSPRGGPPKQSLFNDDVERDLQDAQDRFNGSYFPSTQMAQQQIAADVLDRFGALPSPSTQITQQQIAADELYARQLQEELEQLDGMPPTMPQHFQQHSWSYSQHPAQSHGIGAHHGSYNPCTYRSVFELVPVKLNSRGRYVRIWYARLE
jgi:hypothetical protein